MLQKIVYLIFQNQIRRPPCCFSNKPPSSFHISSFFTYSSNWVRTTTSKSHWRNVDHIHLWARNIAITFHKTFKNISVKFLLINFYGHSVADLCNFVLSFYQLRLLPEITKGCSFAAFCCLWSLFRGEKTKVKSRKIGEIKKRRDKFAYSLFRLFAAKSKRLLSI